MLNNSVLSESLILLERIVLPWTVELYIIKEYAVLITTIRINSPLLMFLIKAILLIAKISEIKLNVGGAAILDIKIKNQKVGILLDQTKAPLVNSILRE
jgi:hypothetical protein